jgi:hypothetical protein
LNNFAAVWSLNLLRRKKLLSCEDIQDDTIINVARFCFGLNMFTTLPLELFVCREVCFVPGMMLIALTDGVTYR